MRMNRIIPLVLSVCLFPVSGCGMSGPDSSAEGKPAAEPVRFDLNRMKEEVSALQELWTFSGKEAEITEKTEELLRMVDEAYELYIRTEMQYYLNMQDEVLEAAQQQAYTDYCVADEIASWAFSNGYKKTGYLQLFAPYVDEEWLSYYNTTTMSRVMANARNDASASGGRLTEYYDTVFDSDTGIDEANETCAELYLDTLDAYDTHDYLYGMYHRDYTVEQASAAFEVIKETLIPLRDQLLLSLETEDEPLSADPYEILKQYAPKLSPEIAKSVEMLFADHLYQAAEGDAYTGSYTVSLPNIPAARMYTYLYDSVTDLYSVVHEFGHFHAERDETTHVCMQANCADIAEVQSQGMEMLFTQFYGDIFGAEAQKVECLTLYNMLDAVISGFAVGEFEYEIMRDRDSMTPEAVLEHFDAISDECGLLWDLYEITHLYEQPGYYVSYGVSALASLELYNLLQQDSAAAMEQYDAISEISALSGENAFCAAMEQSGFADPFEESVIRELADCLASRINELVN